MKMDPQDPFDVVVSIEQDPSSENLVPKIEVAEPEPEPDDGPEWTPGQEAWSPPRRIIKSVGDNQFSIMRDIVDLYCRGKIDCDPTYSVGNFYKTGLPQPKHKFDLVPQVDGVIEADSRKLPLEEASIESLMFDPPFISASINEGKDGIMKKRFSYLKNMKLLWEYYNESLKEFYRVLKPNGVLVFKCQDVIESSKNWFTHCQVMNQAVELGFTPEDLFILTAKNRPIQSNLKEQQHARKFHSYYWVFEKKECKLPYTLENKICANGNQN